MAGSYRHVTDKDNKFTGVSLLENNRDVYQCVEEMYDMIEYLTGGDRQKIFEAHRDGHLKKRLAHFEAEKDRFTFAEFWFDNSEESS